MSATAALEVRNRAARRLMTPEQLVRAGFGFARQELPEPLRPILDALFEALRASLEPEARAILARRARCKPDLVIVACASKKGQARAPARELYASPLFRKSRALAERIGAPWRILSAKHGLIAPDAPIDPYDISIDQLDQAGRHELLGRVRRELKELLAPLPSPPVIEILGGSSYRSIIGQALVITGTRALIQDPMEGLEIGERLRWLNEELPADDPAQHVSEPLTAQEEKKAEAIDEALIPPEPSAPPALLEATTSEPPAAIAKIEAAEDLEKGKARAEANLRAMELVASGRALSESERREVMLYSGWGGLSIRRYADRFPKDLVPEAEGLIAEYYTPTLLCEEVARVVRPLLLELEAGRGSVRALEPAAGIGRFVNACTGPGFEHLAWNVVEYSPVSARLLSALRPDLEVFQGPFESWVVRHENDMRGQLDLVIQNPPYGPRGSTKALDNDQISEEESRAYVYFLRRAFDLLRAGGLGVALVPAGLLTAPSAPMRALREWMLRRFHLAAAFRLPSELFPGANLVTDLSFWRARGGAVAEVPEQDRFILDARYFEVNPKHILGEEVNLDNAELEDEGAAAVKGRWRYKIEGQFKAIPPFAWRAQCFDCEVRAEDPRAKGSKAVTRELVELTGEGALEEASRLGARFDRYMASIAQDTPEAEDLHEELKDAFVAWQKRFGADGFAKVRAGARGNAAAERFEQAWASPGELIPALAQRPVRITAEDEAASIPLTAARLYAREGRLALFDLQTVLRLQGRLMDASPLIDELVGQGWCLDILEGGLNGQWLMVPDHDYYTGQLWPKYDRAKARAEQEGAPPYFAAQRDKLLQLINPVAIESVETIAPNHGWVPLEVLGEFFNDECGAISEDGVQRRKDIRAAQGGYEYELKLVYQNGLYMIDGVEYEDLGSLKSLGTMATREQRDFVGWLNADRKTFNPEHSKEESLFNVRAEVAEEWVEKFRRFVLEVPARARLVEEAYNRAFRGFIDPTYGEDALTVTRWDFKAVTPKRWQYGGARRAVANGGGLIAFDVGVGKTYTGLLVIAKLRELGRAKRPVILVPNSIIWKWFKDIERALPDYRIGVIGSERELGKRKLPKEEAESRARAQGLPIKSKTPREGIEYELAQKARPDTPEERGRKWTEFQAGSYDVVLLAYTALIRTQVNAEAVEKYVGGVEAIKRSIALGKIGEKKSKTKKQQEATERKEAEVANRVQAWIGDILKIQKGWEYDKGVAWDDLGIDLLVVDEAQNFKNLYSPEPQRGSSPPKFMGSSGNESKRAWQLDFRAAAVRRNAKHGTGIVLLSATPAKNSPLEFYNILQFIDPGIWTRMGIQNSEQFIQRYCDIEERMTMDLQGEVGQSAACVGFKELHELRAVIRRYGDFKIPEDLRNPDGTPALTLPKPKIEVITVEMNFEQGRKYAAYRKQLKDAKAEREMGEMLSIMSRMALVSLHPALDILTDSGNEGTKERFKRGLSDEFSPSSPKVDACASWIAEVHKENPGCGHIVFVENVAVHGFLKRRLEQLGFPGARIAILNSATAEDTAYRQQLAEEFNGNPEEGEEPKYDVVIANQIAYEGIDLQKRTCAIHHLDLPWEPATLAQRNGRGVRQGNRLDAIAIRYYLAAGSADSQRFQNIDGKAGWMKALLHETDREINNPAAQQDFRGDVIAYLAENEADAQAQYAEALAEFNAEQRARMAKLAAKKLHPVSDLFARARRAQGEAAIQLFKQAEEGLESALAALAEEHWPWKKLALAVREHEILVPRGPAGGAPVFKGMRARAIVTSRYGASDKKDIEIGQVVTSSKGRSAWVRAAGEIPFSQVRQEAFDEASGEASPSEGGTVCIPSPDRLEPADWGGGKDDEAVRKGLAARGPHDSLDNKTFFHGEIDWWKEKWWPVYLEMRLPGFCASKDYKGEEDFARHRTPVVIGGKLAKVKRSEVCKGVVLPPTEAGWLDFVALVSEQAPEDLAEEWSDWGRVARDWWGKTLPKAPKKKAKPQEMPEEGAVAENPCNCTHELGCSSCSHPIAQNLGLPGQEGLSYRPGCELNPKKRYDYAEAVSVLDRIENPAQRVQEIRRMLGQLEPGGVWFTSVCPASKLQREAIEGDWLPKGDGFMSPEGFRKGYTEKELGQLLERAGLRKGQVETEGDTVYGYGVLGELNPKRGELQSIVVRKGKTVTTLKQAKRLAREHGAADVEPDTQRGKWRFRQKPPSAFVKGSFRSVKIPHKKGGGHVVLVYGRPKRRNPKASEGASGEKDVRMPRDAVELERLPAVAGSGAYGKAAASMEERYGKPTHAIEVEDLPGAPDVLATIGRLERIDYTAADAPDKPLTYYFHHTGTHAEGPDTRKPLLLYDAEHDDLRIGKPKGAKISFGPRGIEG